MEDDFIASLTRQVKEDVIERYLSERRLIEFQMEDLDRLATGARAVGASAGKRLARMSYLMIDSAMHGKLAGILGIPPDSQWRRCLGKTLPKGVRFIRVRALTDRARYRKLVLQAYQRLYGWMEKHRTAYSELVLECNAVNLNIRKFRGNFDLLAILSLLRSLDTEGHERRMILGENFTPEERSSLDARLHVPLVDVTRFDVPAPLVLPAPAAVEKSLTDLANEVFDNFQRQVRRFLR